MHLKSCGPKFLSSTDQQLYGFNRTVPGLSGERPVISYTGCRALCGSGADTYAWSEIASSITTWIFPIISIILQAPFESNNTAGTFFALLRWIGSPISSLSHIFWNIKVSGKAALIVDMATRYDEYPREDSDFRAIRDSFYILIVMNQYKINPRMRGKAVIAERLLRTALFDDSLKVGDVELVKLREKIATSLRSSRKRGVVPVFISMAWFLFSMAISIQAAFSNIGPIEQPDNLGLGLSLAWVPILVLSSIIDRNPGDCPSVQKILNGLLRDVQHSLVTASRKEQSRRGSMSQFGNDLGGFSRRRSSLVPIGQQDQTDPEWIRNHLNTDVFKKEDFFVGFGGQGRRRFHYGVAYTIVAGIEDEFVRDYGRDWLQHPNAREKLVKGSRKPNGIFFFDLRELWQIASAVIIVPGSIFGAFILNYFTPPIGVGCRSGGYAIFCCWSTLIFILEMIVWWWTSHFAHDEFKTQRYLERWVFIPAEAICVCWLLYTITAQSTGIYNTCWCLTWEGWFNFETTGYWNSPSTQEHWITALCLSLIIMAISFSFIIVEWCTQSHMTADNYNKAKRGLARTRKFKMITSPARDLVDFVITKVKSLWGSQRKSLVWKKSHVTRRRESVSEEPIPEAEEDSQEEEEKVGIGKVEIENINKREAD